MHPGPGLALQGEHREEETVREAGLVTEGPGIVTEYKSNPALPNPAKASLFIFLETYV